MIKTVHQRLKQIKEEGYDLDFSDTFNLSFEVYKRIALQAGIAFLIYFIVLIAVGLGLVGFFIGFNAMSQTMVNFDPTNLGAAYMLIYIVGVSAFTALVTPFTAGILKMAYDADMGQDFSIATTFNYYKGHYFGQLFLAGFILALFGQGLSLGFEVTGSLIVSFIGKIISLLVTFFTLMTIPLIIFGNLKAYEAIGSSFLVVLKSPFMILGLVLVSFILALVGMIAFCIGILFTIPFIYTTYYAIYKNSVGVSEESEIDEIGLGEL